ncbi:hypothetical protein LDENG_00151620 [Lucifuga dentata]|nr:hypothetical protein LDENG_00151620 [Lucifuga dentata]
MKSVLRVLFLCLFPPEFEDKRVSECDSDFSDAESDSDEDSDEETFTSGSGCQEEPCRHYNSGFCRDGNKCNYLHFCKYALKGNCRYGSSCRLKHPVSSNESSTVENSRSTSAEMKLSDGRYYQWQLNDGKGWKDVDNDHIIEAHYSLPHTKRIKIYNTPYGVVNIDFKKMRVYGKSLKVRRLDDGHTTWFWYCSFRHKWVKYGEKDLKGKASPVQSSDIEKKFQTNPASSYTFNIGADTFEIRYREMHQVGAKRNRKVARRPQYRAQHAGVGPAQAAAGFLGTKSPAKSPIWQFEGDSGKWHDFKHRSGTQTESSVSSDDIERKYQQNPHGSMSFTVTGQSYKLDFGAMIQTNLRNKNTRKVRRVLS